jgi:hypothetical protein
MSNVYGKIPLVANTSTMINVGGSGLSGLVIGNDSGFTCLIELQGANTKRTLYAGMVDFVPVPPNVNWTGNLLITPSSDLNNIQSWPASFLQIDTFGLGEQPSGQYPINLNRTGNIGNQVTTVVGSSTSVQNDNNASGTQFVESTVLGSPSSNTLMNNDGSGWFGRWVNPTFTKFFQWFSTGATALKLGAVGLLTEILGNIQVDGNEVVTGTGSWNGAGATIDSSSNFNGNGVSVNTANVGTINCTTMNATTVAATGNETVGGTLGVTGSSSLDNGHATTDGSGNVTATSFNTANGVVSGVHFLATPFLLDNAGTLASGATVTETVTGGSTGVPTGAKGVLLSSFFSASAVGGFMQWRPHGATVSDSSNYPLLLSQVAGAVTAGNFIVACDASGKIDVAAHSANMTAIHTSINGYII